MYRQRLHENTRRMSHLHFPDGVLPQKLVIASFAACVVLLGVASRRLSSKRGAVQLVAAMAALMLVAMSMPLLLLPVHLNLACLVGIIAGGWNALVASFSVSVICAMMQHGGISVIGLNTLILTLEAAIASYVFRKTRARGAVLSAGLSAALALGASQTAMIAVLALAGPANSRFELLAHRLLMGDGHIHAFLQLGSRRDIGVAGVLSAAVPLLLAALVLEAVATALIAGFVSRVRPTLLQRD